MPTPPLVPTRRNRRALLIFGVSAAGAGLLAAGTHLTRTPLLLPPIGATTYLCFARPELAASSPRNAILGHAIGVLCGIAALALYGLVALPPAAAPEMDWPRVAACALALGTTSAAMLLLAVDHPPAGATTLVVAFGVCPFGFGLASYLGGVALLLAFAAAVNRLRGVAYPLWNA